MMKYIEAIKELAKKVYPHIAPLKKPFIETLIITLALAAPTLAFPALNWMVLVWAIGMSFLGRLYYRQQIQVWVARMLGILASFLLIGLVALLWELLQ